MIRISFLFFLIIFFSTKSVTADTIEILNHKVVKAYNENYLITFEKIILLHPFLIEKKDEAQKEKIRKSENKTNYFFITMLLLFGFAGIRMLFPNQFQQLNLILYNNNKTQTESDQMAMLSFYALYYIAVATFIYFYFYLFKNYFNNISIFKGLLISITFIALVHILKLGLCFLLSWVFNFKNYFNQYVISVTEVYKLTSIILFPLSAILFIASKKTAYIILTICFIILILSIILKIIKNKLLIKKLSTLYFFQFLLYLCAFELIPILIIISFSNRF